MLAMRGYGVACARRGLRSLGSVVGGVGVAALVALSGCGRAAPTGGPLPTLAIIGETGRLPGQFGTPRCIDHDGRTLWVVDRLARVQQFDMQSKEVLQEWRTPKFDRGKPTGITIWRGKGKDGAGGLTLLCIADTHEARVLVYVIADASGNRTQPDEHGRPPLLASFGAFGEDLGLFIYTTDIAIVSTPDGTGIVRMYVGEYGGNDRVSAWEPAGGDDVRDGVWTPTLRERTADERSVQMEAKFAFGSFGVGANEFNRPQSLDVWRGMDGVMHTPDDELIVVDACNHRVGRFSLRGEVKQWYGSGQGSTDAPGGFSYPYGLAILEDDSALVTEFGNNRVQRLNLKTGECLGLLGEGGRAPGQLVTPWGVTVMGETTYVLDTGNARVQAFATPTGKRAVTSATLGGPAQEGGGK